MSVTTKPILTLTAKATGNVTAGRAVTFSGVQVAAAGALALGIARSDATNGQFYPVDVSGTSEMTSGAAVAIGEPIQCDANGRGVAQTTGALVGWALTAATAADKPFEILLAK